MSPMSPSMRRQGRWIGRVGPLAAALLAGGLAFAQPDLTRTEDRR